MDYYRKIIDALREYFPQAGWERLFLSGGCYWLANLLHQGIQDSVLMINRLEEHCALQNFHPASQREIRFMQKNYVPRFETKGLEQYLAARMQQVRPRWRDSKCL